jgi:hypothetical protein
MADLLKVLAGKLTHAAGALDIGNISGGNGGG